MDIQKLANATMNFDQSAIDGKINSIRYRVNKLENHVKTAWLVKAIGFIDLTTLGGDDTPSKIETLCTKAVNPLKLPSNSHLHTASVCVYPMRFVDAMSILEKLDKEHKISRATVGGGFPSGQFPLETRLREVEIGVELGADEIDIVINRPLALMQQWKELYEELKSFRVACAMMAGADFIKTSTGKEAINATLSAGVIMCQAIKDYYESTQRKVGLKPAGGIKVPQEALEWMMLVQMELGEEWLSKDLFRIGASNLLDNIVEAIQSN
ncbi:deoxyribose-phosphate aldolase isoform X2 [Bombus flavifrons]|uniref:deoxyribose-phosphate aldolase isoform X2 n=1 Tax=Bombus flavifrons TaxID=103934 RepID=UPI003704C6AC